MVGPVGPSTLTLVPPKLPSNPAWRAREPNLLIDVLLYLVSALAFVVSRIIKWALFGTLAFYPMLVVGALGIPLMVLFGVGVAILKMAAY